ncbi:MAG: type IX secretion system membrane protein PorP/SprF [Bacteroidetes bacterium]|nr:type IX secretion system membrane protein PorP/SprF [Bacteroidota bacterium]
MNRYLVFVLLLLSLTVQAQFYTPFAQGQSLPLYQNPSFAGTVVYPRFTLGTVMDGFKRPSILNISRTYFSYDQYVPDIRSGVGIMCTSNPVLSSPVEVKRFQSELFFSPKIKLKNKMTLSTGVSAGLSSNVLYASDLYSNDPQNPLRFSYSLGAIVHSPTFYVGYSFRQYPGAKLLSSSDSSHFSIEQNSKFVSTVQTAYVFRKKKSDRITFSPALLLQFYRLDNGFLETRYQVNFSLKRNFFFWGAGFSTNSIFMTIGFQGERVRLVYSASQITEPSTPYSSSKVLFAQEMVLSYTFIHKDK